MPKITTLIIISDKKAIVSLRCDRWMEWCWHLYFQVRLKTGLSTNTSTIVGSSKVLQLKLQKNEAKRHKKNKIKRCTLMSFMNFCQFPLEKKAIMKIQPRPIVDEPPIREWFWISSWWRIRSECFRILNYVFFKLQISFKKICKRLLHINLKFDLFFF